MRGASATIFFRLAARAVHTLTLAPFPAHPRQWCAVLRSGVRVRRYRAGNVTWFMGVNEYSDLTHAEFKAMRIGGWRCGCRWAHKHVHRLARSWGGVCVKGGGNRLHGERHR